MPSQRPFAIPLFLHDVLETGIEELSVRVPRARKGDARNYRTLRPGVRTPLWCAMRAELKLLLRKWGSQARLARYLGVPRQQVNYFVTGKNRMPDAERTLMLLAWLMVVKRKPKLA